MPADVDARLEEARGAIFLNPFYKAVEQSGAVERNTY
jgi:hypothetical protein